MTDAKPLSKAYYRLRIVDFDGSFEYSNIVLLERKKTDFGFINVYPVPTNGEVKVEYQIEENLPLTFKVLDVLGRTLEVQKVNAIAGFNSINFDLSNLPSAMYMITMESGSKRKVFKIAKVD